MHVMGRVTMDYMSDSLRLYLIKKGVLVIFREVGKEGNPHYHFVVPMPDNTLRTRLRAEFKDQPGGSRKFAVTVCHDLEGALRYCCKGEERGRYDLNYSVVDAEAYHNAYWDEHDRIKDPKQKKARAQNMLDEIWEDIREDIGNTISGYEIAARVYRWYMSKNKRLPTSFAMSSMCATFAARVNENDMTALRLSDKDMCVRLYPGINF